MTRLDGDGVPDLLVGRAGRTWLVEVKCPYGPRGGLPTRAATDGLTEPQVDWWNAWRGERPTIVRTEADVEQLLATQLEPELHSAAREVATSIATRRRT
ncbi:MAG TPA: hypothetical protein VHH11_03830 [Gammaproteobacteria bacterium]|nr:hypothetical protein [Gammaproteobacteria bacterium]